MTGRGPGWLVRAASGVPTVSVRLTLQTGPAASVLCRLKVRLGLPSEGGHPSPVLHARPTRPHSPPEEWMPHEKSEAQAGKPFACGHQPTGLDLPPGAADSKLLFSLSLWGPCSKFVPQTSLLRGRHQQGTCLVRTVQLWKEGCCLHKRVPRPPPGHPLLLQCTLHSPPRRGRDHRREISLAWEVGRLRSK